VVGAITATPAWLVCERHADAKRTYGSRSWWWRILVGKTKVDVYKELATHCQGHATYSEHCQAAFTVKRPQNLLAYVEAVLEARAAQQAAYNADRALPLIVLAGLR
jgi:hypothetical protein